jgi:cellulose synthase/poly-beta-1,6-N-acetylglucosamine synthase-like glycosyltransferase
MKLIDVLLLVPVALHLIESIRHLNRMSSSLRWLKQPYPLVHKKLSSNTLHLLIPIYREAAVLKACIDYFEQFAHLPGAQLYYVTTEKEGLSSDTIAVLKELQKCYTFTWLHYPEKHGMKADQLNWAIEQILSSDNIDERSTYFGIYDVDSRPVPGAIETVLYGTDPVYQQPSIYLENYKRISLFQQAGALLQTKWELCRNVPVLRDYSCCLHEKRPLATLPCCTGHGLFIRADIFQHIDGVFDTKTLTEDLELGYRLAFYNIPIIVLPEVDFTDYALTAIATIPQTSRWFSGEVSLFRYSKKALQDRHLNLLVLKRYYTTFKWAFGAPLLLFSLIFLTIRYPASIAVDLLVACLYVYIPFKLLYDSPLLIERLGNKKRLFVLVLMGCMRPLFNSLGPFHFLFTRPIDMLLGRPLTFARTPKN